MPDIAAVMPALGQVSHPLLTDRAVTLVGVSAVLYDDEAYYFGVAEPHNWGEREDGASLVGVGGIGGGIEHGEGPLASLRRQVREGLGVPLQLESPDRTALIHEGEVAAWLELPTSRRHPAPFGISLLPPQLGGPGMPDHLAIATYLGCVQRQPRRADLFGLVTIARPAVEAFFERDEWPLDDMLAQADFTLDLASDLPTDSVLRPTLAGHAFQVLLRHQSV